ncbi:hypothetical protein [Vannielia sp.]|uniref:hypothetical protein n=1 Tax=Vannielia sp. TaxID=2813045 RepID=UPI00262F0F87|nr:hypothetical protein [Vannielia sp.]MDF1872964.1 hypothetical protein [Vannielia sp.]
MGGAFRGPSSGEYGAALEAVSCAVMGGQTGFVSAGEIAALSPFGIGAPIPGPITVDEVPVGDGRSTCEILRAVREPLGAIGAA